MAVLSTVKAAPAPAGPRFDAAVSWTEVADTPDGRPALEIVGLLVHNVSMRAALAMGLVLALIGAAVAMLGRSAWRALLPETQQIPAPSVSDRAGVLKPASEARLSATSEALLRDAGVDLVTVVVPSLEGEVLASVALKEYETARVGARSPGNRGLLLLVAAQEQKVRLEVGYELEGLLPDAFIHRIEADQMEPYFEDALVGEGIEATVELIAAQLFEALRSGDYDPDQVLAATGASAGGAGAERSVPVTAGSGSNRAAAGPDTKRRFGPQPSPEAAWQAFLEIQRRRIKDPELGIYDEAATEILRRRPNSDAAQRHLFDLYAEALPEVRQQKNRAAVVFLDDPEHLLAPWFFHRTPEGWRLDGSMPPEVIAYNHLNQWHFSRRDHPYAFAFTDFTLDRHGFARWKAP